MTDKNDPNKNNTARDFAEHAEADQVGIVREFWDFLRYNKKWWLTPIIVSLLLLGVLVLLSSTAAAPACSSSSVRNGAGE